MELKLGRLPIVSVSVAMVLILGMKSAKAVPALEFQSQATVYDMTPRDPSSLSSSSFPYSSGPPPMGELLASELLYVTPIDYSHQGSGSGMIRNPVGGDSSASASGSGSGSPSTDGGVDYDELVSNVRTYMSDMRDTMMSVPTNIGNALLSMWAANAEQSRRAAAEAEKNKPKKPIVHWGKPVTVKKMNMKAVAKPHVMMRMRPADATPAGPAPVPIIVQVVMSPTPVPTPADDAGPGPITAPSEQVPHHRGRGRPGPRGGGSGRRPLFKRQTHRPRPRPGQPQQQRPRRGGHPPPGRRMQPRVDQIEEHQLNAKATASMKFLVL